EVREIGNVPYYVVRLGDLDHYYTRGLDWAAAARTSKVEARMIPPHPWFVWPLEVGKRWTYQGFWEEHESKRDLSNRFAVVAVEAVEVPAGRFETLKVVRESDSRDYDEYWYAPAVRWHVRWKGRRGDLEFEERLQSYDPAPRLIPPGTDVRAQSPSPRRPSFPSSFRSTTRPTPFAKFSGAWRVFRFRRRSSSWTTAPRTARPRFFVSSKPLRRR